MSTKRNGRPEFLFDNTNKTVIELEDSVDFNDGEIPNLKRDMGASQKSIDDLSKQLLYQEHYSRRENLIFMGIAERNVMDGQGTQQEPESRKRLFISSWKKKCKFRTHAAASNFKEFTEWESLRTMALAQ